MWSPADKYTLPSVEDTLKANEVIHLLKIEIGQALARLAEAQRHVDNLMKDLREREAWLSPIRRLPFDVLSIIFTLCGREDWTAPVSLGSVCRTWRAALLSTPRAWSFIDIKDECSRKALPIFLERGGMSPLHVGIPKTSDGGDFFAVARISNKILCLSVSHFSWEIRGMLFNNLKRLRIRDETSPAALKQIKGYLFPVLLYMEFSYIANYDEVSLNEVAGFPPLHALRFSVNAGVTFFRILKKCGESLRFLDMETDIRTSITQDYPINLPRLEALNFYDTGVATGFVRNHVIMVTPSLRSLVMHAVFAQDMSYIKVDARIVTHLRITGERLSPSLSTFPNLKVMQLATPASRLLSILNTLAQDRAVCPNLQIIEFMFPMKLGRHYRTVENAIEKMNSGGGRHLRFGCVLNWSNELPGVIYWSCGSDMPCSK